MDFGIEEGIEDAAKIYFQSVRGTGRTTSMVNSLKNGDRVIFHNSKERNRVDQICRKRGLKITTVVVPTEEINNILSKGTSQGKTILDHSWIEIYYLAKINRIKNDIKFFQKIASGWGEAHEETKLKAKKLVKWNNGNKGEYKSASQMQ